MTSGRARRVALPPDPELRVRRYRELAVLMARAPSDGLVLFEGAVDGRPPVVTIRPEEALPAAWKEPTSVGADPAPRPRVPRWVGASAEGFDLVPTAATAGAGRLPLVRELLPSRGRPHRAPPAIQTFWASRGGDERIWVARRCAVGGGPPRSTADTPWVRGLEDEWSARTGRPARLVAAARGWARDWVEGGVHAVPRLAWRVVAPEAAELTAEPWLVRGAPGGGDGERHTAVFGATGAGKTSFLADLAARAVRRGDSVVAIDLHGDLAPSLFARLPPGLRDTVVAVDASDRPTLGVAALSGRDERAAGHLVGAVKRLTPDGQDVYWGFRLERVFDTFVRLVQENGGSLLDLYDLLTDADRRDVARLVTRRPELGRFLDELAPIVRKSPDFLWPAAARLAKIALDPALAELLAPRDGGVDVEGLVSSGRPIVVRLPFAQLGPEAAAFAGTLVLARIYLGVASAPSQDPRGRRWLVVLDEVHGFSPRLVTEILTDGRKFGLRLLLATQYPDRLTHELRSAVAGTVRDVVAFRVPPASAADVGRWLGLDPATAERVLPALATGAGVVRRPGTSELVAITAEDAPAPAFGPWSDRVRSARKELGGPAAPGPEPDPDAATEAVLLAVLGAEEDGLPLARDGLVAAVGGLATDRLDPAVILDRLLDLERRRWVESSEGRLRLTPGGSRRLGLRADTGASRESPEHRALLLRAFRLFARRGCRMEIVRQGRFDTTLPDGVVRQLPRLGGARSPREVAEAVDRARGTWAWRFFLGQDVFVEVEVSGALRPERIRRGVAKALRRGSFALFVVGDPRRAARVRTVLRGLGLGLHRAQVWTLGSRPHGLPEDVGTPRGPARCDVGPGTPEGRG